MMTDEPVSLYMLRVNAFKAAAYLWDLLTLYDSSPVG